MIASVNKVWVFLCVCLMVGCSTVTVERADIVYQIGDKGPAGGIIFYDDEADGVDDLPGARYLEAAPADLKGDYVWGVKGEHLGSGGGSVGSGKEGTQKFVEMYPDGNYAANACNAYRLKRRRDWFLPSRGTVSLMYRELKTEALGDFSDGIYLSIAEDDPDYAEGVDFSNGSERIVKKGTPYKVRAVRSF